MHKKLPLLVFVLAALLLGAHAQSGGGQGIAVQFQEVKSVPASCIVAGIVFEYNNAGTYVYYTCPTAGSAPIVIGGGSSAFSAITSGTNTAAAMLVGSGASLGFTGTGTINANQLLGVGVSGTPATNDVLTYNGTDWAPASGASAGVASLSTTVPVLGPYTGAVVLAPGPGIEFQAAPSSGNGVELDLAQSSTSTFGGLTLGGSLGGAYNAQTVLDLDFASGATKIPLGAAPTGSQCLVYNGTNITGGACGGSSAWSSLTNPTGALSLDTGAYTSTWTITGNTATATNVFQFNGNDTNTGTGAIIGITQGGATDPLAGLRVNQEGNTGTPGIDVVRGANNGQDLLCVSTSAAGCDLFHVNSYGNVYGDQLFTIGGVISSQAANLTLTAPTGGAVQIYPRPLQFTINVPTGSTPILDLNTGNVQQYSCTSAGISVSPTLNNIKAGEKFTVIFVQNGTTACTWTWPSTIHGGGTVSATLGSVNVQEFVVSNNGTDAYAVSALQTSSGGTP